MVNPTRGALRTPAAMPQARELWRFRCHLCDTANAVPFVALGREEPSCSGCGSTVRFRAIGRLLARELVGRDEALCRMRPDRSIRGIGLTDSGSYAPLLAQRFDYVNTFFDADPRLDITDVPDALAHRFRFVVASDVFEHVPAPAARAFAGARRLLDRDGFLLLTVPFSLEAQTIEHYPDLHAFSIEGAGDSAVLHNVTRDGRSQRFERLVFHGGSGATLEMRRFCRTGLERELAQAGFSRIRFADEAFADFGIAWPEPFGVPVVARP
jgi:hypothetical protein